MKRSIVKNEYNTYTKLSDSHRYSNEIGEISLLYPCFATQNLFEIYCIEGDLFYDIERYSTLEEAEDRIKELLDAVRLDRDDRINDILK